MGRVSRLTKQTVYNWHPGAPVNDRGLGLNKMKGFSGSGQTAPILSFAWDGNTLIRGEDALGAAADVCCWEQDIHCVLVTVSFSL